MHLDRPAVTPSTGRCALTARGRDERFADGEADAVPEIHAWDGGYECQLIPQVLELPAPEDQQEA